LSCVWWVPVFYISGLLLGTALGLAICMASHKREPPSHW
jgi:hypothetical protein